MNEKLLAELKRVTNEALNDHEVAADVSAMTLAMCRLSKGERKRVLAAAYGILDARITLERERYRVFDQAGCGVVPGPDGES